MKSRSSVFLVESNDHMKLLKELNPRITGVCPKCGSLRNCGMEKGKSASTCWCMSATSIPRPIPDSESESCLCSNCLKEEDGC